MNEEEIFHQALARDRYEDRAAYLAQACAGDPALRASVEALLRANVGATGFLDQPADAPVALDMCPLIPGSESKVIGPYKLMEQIGEGGFGLVFVAEQQEPVRRKVALKIIKAGMDTRQVIARFEQERQALAMMDHPNIAKVHDAGTTEGGRPYFVMELVKGLPITKFCDQERLTPKERLELFIPVCQAVQHAHQKGIIHRDIKPSNVIVAVYDGKPIPKVIDFGVAKATGRSPAERTLYTEVGMLVGTLEYMAPEQAEVNNLDIDTRADIYSLGVLLYELLTGSPPFTSKELRTAGYDAMMRMIREVEPPKPSTKLSSSDELPSIAANRKLEPKSLRKLVAGELDWIAMKCLEKERGRRYETANGLAMDVQRYLADEPVGAGPPSKVYRVRKFVRRNRGPVAAVSFVLLALVAGVIGTTWGLISTRMARIEEQIAKETALKRLGQIEKGNEILASIFFELRPESEKKEGKPLRALLGERLEQAIAQLQEEAIGNAVTVAKLQSILGRSLLGLGYAEKAIPLLRQSLVTLSDHLGPAHIHTLPSMYNLAWAYQKAGRLDLALPLSEESLKLHRATLGSDHRATLGSMQNLAVCYLDAGKLDRALPLLKESLTLLKAKLGPDDPDTLGAMDNLATAYGDAGKLDLALALNEESLKLHRAKLGSDHPYTLASMESLAVTYGAAGQRDLALSLYEEALALRKAKLGSEHPDTIFCMINVGRALKSAGKLEQALPVLEEALRLAKAKLGPDHPHTLAAISSLAGAYQDAGKRDLALPLLEETLKLRKAKLGPDHPDTLTSMDELATGYQAAGKLELALPLKEASLELRKTKLGPDHADTLDSMDSLGQAYLDAERLDVALPLLEETLNLTKAKCGPQHPRTLRSMNSLAGAYTKAGKLDVALPLLEEALTLVKATHGPGHPVTVVSMNNLGHAYLDAERLDVALPLLEETLNLMKAKLGSGHPVTLNTMNGLANGYGRAGKLDLALPLFQQAAEGVERLKFLDKHAGGFIDNLSDCYERLQQFHNAETWRRKWLGVVKERSGAESAAYGQALGPLGNNLVMQKKYTDAEPILREALAILEKREPGHWRRFTVKSQLGAALLGQEKYPDAEPLLLQGHEGLKQREEKIPKESKGQLTEAVERLVQLYDAWDKPEEAEKWRAKLPKKKEDGDRPPQKEAGDGSKRVEQTFLSAQDCPDRNVWATN
jgi:serine/threonine protein kinase/tetratricopeptide (TPR) repeat protein